MTPFILCCTVIAVASIGLCALYLRRIAQEARAVSKLLQARWDYEMAKIKWRVEGSRLTPRKTSQEATQQRALQVQADVPAIRRKMPCRRRCYGRQIFRRW